mmetsp:Transcript_8680/g.12343  ORF Transcript_8680/g.12343 Transcript_8680/m.12343 type:complete len:93 (-) Transcript_8680:125-403(-)
MRSTLKTFRTPSRNRDIVVNSPASKVSRINGRIAHARTEVPQKITSHNIYKSFVLDEAELKSMGRRKIPKKPRAKLRVVTTFTGREVLGFAK